MVESRFSRGKQNNDSNKPPSRPSHITGPADKPTKSIFSLLFEGILRQTAYIYRLRLIPYLSEGIIE